jgi:hypothetical protein
LHIEKGEVMKFTHTALAAAVAAMFSVAAHAQTAGTEVQRDVNQEKRIEQGLQSGQLTTREAGKLEKEEAQVNRAESNALKDGKLTAQEKARIQREQNQVSRDIYRQKHDAQVGNPNSASSKRMQADVQRNINQQSRIDQGINSGQLTNHEAAKLERGQARVDRKEARASADGHVGAAEQANIQSAENRQSKRIFRQKHDAQVR